VSALAASNKELQLLLLPVVFTARVSRDGARPALVKTAASAAGALATVALLRWWWAPSRRCRACRRRTPGRPILGALWTLRARRSAACCSPACCRSPRGRRCCRGHAPTCVATASPLLTMLAFPFAAFLNVGEARPPVLFGKNTDRLLLFAVPVLLPLALHAVEAVLRRPEGRSRCRTTGLALVERAGWAATALFLLALGLGLDRYRREDLRGSRDGPLLLAFCRESLRVAGRLERGGDVGFEPGAMRSAGASTTRPRWRACAGSCATAGATCRTTRTATRAPQAAEATVTLPCLRPRPLAVELVLDASRPVPVGVRVKRDTDGDAPGRSGRDPARLRRARGGALPRGQPPDAHAAGSADAVALRRVAWRAPVIHTVGHSTRPIADFIALLREGGRAHVWSTCGAIPSRAATRSSRGRRSRRASRTAASPTCTRSTSAATASRGRTRRTPPGGSTRSARYADHMSTPAFQAALGRVAALEHAAVMCAEAEPTGCHRQLLADALVARGLTVRHLIAPGEARDHVLHPRAVCRDGRLVYPAAGQLHL
jgi:hypothetical protein